MKRYERNNGSNRPIDQAGRIVLPKDVRQELAIKPSDTLKLSIHGSSVTLTPHKATAGFVRKGKALIFTSAGNEVLTDADVSNLLAGSREERETVNFSFSHERKRRS